MFGIPALTLGLTAANFVVNLDILAATHEVVGYHRLTQQYHNNVLYLLSNISNMIGGGLVMEPTNFSEDIHRLKESLHKDLQTDYTAQDLASMAHKVILIEYLEKCSGKETTGHIY